MIGSRAATGAAWLVGARLATRLIDFVTMLILARLLSPADFGLVAVASTTILVIDSVLDLSISQALIRLPDPTRDHYDTAFTLSLIRGATLAALLLLLAWPFGEIFNDARLTPIIVVLGLAPLARGFVSPQLAHYARQLDFSRDFIMEIVGKTMSFSAAVIVGLLTHSYWALVAGMVLAPVALTVTSHILAPYRPRLRLAEWRTFVGFLGWLSAAQAINTLNFQSDRLLLGKFLGPKQVGQYTVGSDLASLPLQALVTPLLKALLSSFSLMRGEVERMKSAYLKVQKTIVTVALPVIIGLALLAKPAIVLALGSKWLPAAHIVEVLAYSYAMELMIAPAAPLAMALGRTHLLFQRSILNVALRVPLLTAGLMLHGLEGLVIARTITAGTMMLVNMWMVKELIGLSLFRQMTAPGRAILSATAMGALLLLTRGALDPLPHLPLQLAGRLVLVGGSAAACYLLAITILWVLAGRPKGVETDIAAAVMKIVRRLRPGKSLPQN